MAALLAASALFLAIHLLVSGTRLRDGIVGAIGERPYLGLFALSSLGAIIWLCIAYNHFYGSAENRVLYDLGQSFRNLAIPIVTIAFLLGVPGVLMANPTSAGQSGAALRGVLRITRHPFLWGVAIWSGYHLLASGVLAAIILFATFLVVALLGTRAIDAKVRRKRPSEWQVISSQTSNIPFLAIFAGRNKFVAQEYFDWRFSFAVLAFAVFLLSHNYLFKMSPFPNNWLPF
ncbi:MAG: NnrU family protein [Rhizomicrobium sp.]